MKGLTGRRHRSLIVRRAAAYMHDPDADSVARHTVI